MNVYKFRLIETYSKVVSIEADSREEAFDMLDQKVSEGDIDAMDNYDDYEREIYDA
jgi:hypothetical protein